jgi:magnesium chelatase accessory protein
MDFPGHGFTRGARTADLTLPGMARALAGLLSQASDLKPVQSPSAIPLALPCCMEMALDPNTSRRDALSASTARWSRSAAMRCSRPWPSCCLPIRSPPASCRSRRSIGRHGRPSASSATGSADRQSGTRLLRHAVAPAGPCQRRAGDDGQLERLDPLIARLDIEVTTPVTLIAAADDPDGGRPQVSREARSAYPLLPDSQIHRGPLWRPPFP